MLQMVLAIALEGQRTAFHPQCHFLADARYSTTLLPLIVHVGNNLVGQADHLSVFAVSLHQSAEHEESRIIGIAFTLQLRVVQHLFTIEYSQPRLSHCPVDVGPEEVGHCCRENARLLSTVHPHQCLFGVLVQLGMQFLLQLCRLLAAVWLRTARCQSQHGDNCCQYDEISALSHKCH